VARQSYINQLGDFPMFKSTLIGLFIASTFSVSLAVAEDKAPAPAPAAAATTSEAAPMACTQAELTAMTTKVNALTDKDKQKAAMGHLDLAKKSMEAKDLDGCAMHMKEAAAGISAVAK
jgi:predicted negative regulator of RcsB-dependent stress response